MLLMVFSLRFKTKGGNMGLNWKILTLAVGVVGASYSEARVLAQYEKDYLTVSTVKVQEITTDVFNNERSKVVYQKDLNMGLPGQASGMPDLNGQIDPTEKVGKVIQTARDLVALGEDVYQLVIKGKPKNTTSYAPISVIPRLNGEAVDLLETENWKMPNKKTYQIVYENLYGMDVVTFRYSVLWSYGGSYDGKGKYITAAQIIPESVRTLFGYDFSATMKLGGIQNNGTRANPLAAATLLLEYSVSTVMVASTSVSSHFILGDGKHKKL